MASFLADAGRDDHYHDEEWLQDTNYPGIPVDEHLNFIRGLLSEADIVYTRDELIEAGNHDFVGLLNSGLPMPTFALETLVAFQIRPSHIRCRQIAEKALKLAIMINHYYRSRSIFQAGIYALRDAMSRNNNLHRIESGLRRLMTALDMEENPFYLIENLEELDVLDGEYKDHLRTVYDICNRAGISIPEETRLLYPRLTLFNHLYMAPLFTSEEAVSVFAENLRSLTLGTGAPLALLTERNATRDPEPVLNDVLFALSMNNALSRHRQELYTLKRWILEKLNLLCVDIYTAYTQVPEIRDLFRMTVLSVVDTLEAGIEDDAQYFTFAPILSNVFQLLKELHKTRVYVLPDFVRFSVFTVSTRLHNAREGVSNGPSDEIDLEYDPTSIFDETQYLYKNPYGNKDLFRCPRNLVRYLGINNVIRARLSHTMMTALEENTFHTDTETTDLHEQLMLEGTAKQLGMLPRQLAQYVNTVEEDRDVAGQTMPELQQKLFADVTIRTLDRSSEDEERARRRRRRGTPATASLVDVNPYTRRLSLLQHRRQRRRRHRASRDRGSPEREEDEAEMIAAMRGAAL